LVLVRAGSNTSGGWYPGNGRACPGTRPAQAGGRLAAPFLHGEGGVYTGSGSPTQEQGGGRLAQAGWDPGPCQAPASQHRASPHFTAFNHPQKQYKI